MSSHDEEAIRHRVEQFAEAWNQHDPSAVCATGSTGEVDWTRWADHHLARCPDLPCTPGWYQQPGTRTHTSCLPVYHRATNDHWDTVLWHHDQAGRSLSRLARLLPLREVSGRYLFFC